MNKLKTAREDSGMTRKQLSEKTGVSVRTIEAYEQGNKDINNAKLKTLLKICDSIGCGLEDIITDQEIIDLLR